MNPQFSTPASFGGPINVQSASQPQNSFSQVPLPSFSSLSLIQQTYNPSSSSIPMSNCAVNQPNGLSTSLLPKYDPNSNNTWTNAACVSNALTNNSFLSPDAQIGSLSSIKNISLDIRGDPCPNVSTPVSIFNNATIAPTFTRPLFCPSDCNKPSIYSCN